MYPNEMISEEMEVKLWGRRKHVLQAAEVPTPECSLPTCGSSAPKSAGCKAATVNCK